MHLAWAKGPPILHGYSELFNKPLTLERLFRGGIWHRKTVEPASIVIVDGMKAAMVLAP